ncbi:MAG: tetratricopeptide repeat protein [Gammaproteobacteria bacterium]|nr:tetratricopeptide repeat protein [Gammaproteobacteria bacterium]
MKKLILTSALASVLMLVGQQADSAFPLGFHTAQAADEASTDKKKRRRTPAMGSRVYSQLARAQELADAGDVPAGLEVLDQVKAKASSLNSYERAMMYNFYGFIYYNAERVPEAISAFEQVVEQEPIPETLEQSTLFSLAQLAMANSRYDDTLRYLNRLDEVTEGPTPVKNLVLKAQASYQNKDYQNALTFISKAISDSKANQMVGEESWYVLQRAIFFELEQPTQVTKVLETMVRLFNKPEYWVQLAGMYGELGEEAKQLAVMEAAYQQGYVEKASDLRNLAQIYYFNGLPYKSAQVLDKAIKANVVEANPKNLKFLAQSWLGAKEYSKAINTYQQLAAKTKDGDADQQIAEIYLQQAKFDKVVTAANNAVKKGELSNPGNLYLALGMAHFNLESFDDALKAFEQAQAHKSSKAMATTWLKFVAREQEKVKQLAAN